ncbi:6,7-dimethyl-8-ribityllumazine synthase [Candidatus Blochmannia vicinus (nom. nud.)]|uniref:6,7-dimethyl-8-ribityllumazine synthase n=1 Tax=Candidatus Blochmannia vicinus (nom. nud.) TaxID=251540 RepID=A0A9Q8TVF3_9ENTR|nr:6,7-dimethyl-8-ribityllumazine synthase [Candidatus Blochmannia vicinus]URJ27959.1 6,7-dimethyl-8-ribityllumazine synthase [Candidatus Blochmannia vicinus]URJ30769.1 6,7-dimethyl-8-ribityllumazine synthase [Candidatus Blochmannia vicinus]
MNIIEGSTTANEAKIAIAVVRFNRFINNNLLEGALDILKRIGHIKDENITTIWTPGAYELPLIVKALAISHKYDGIIALGTVIRGITLHFELIARECSSGLSNISIENTLPIGFGLLTTDNISQAIERSGVKANNKGSEAALAVLEMINILQIIKK